MITSFGFKILLLSLAIVIVGLGASSNAAAVKSSKKPPPQAIAICDTSDVMTLLGRGGPLQHDPLDATTFIQQRIGACKSVIYKYIAGLSAPAIIARNPPGLPALPTPSPNPTFPAGCSTQPYTNYANYKPIALYSALTFCIRWIAGNVPPPPSPGTPTPQPIGFHTPFPGSGDPWTKVIYVLGLASDPGVAAQLSLQLANAVRSPKMRSDLPKPDIYSDRPVLYEVAAMPTWKLADYQQQCFTDPSTAGAIVAVQPGTQSNAYNLIFGSSWTYLNLQLMVLDCEPTSAAYVNNAAYFTWLSHVKAGRGSRYYLNLSTALGVLAMVAGLQNPKTTTYKYPPHTHPPGQPYATSYTQSTFGSTEATTAASVASAFSSSYIFQSPSPDGQAADAIKQVLPKLFDDLMWACASTPPGKTAFPQPQCEWFIYRPKAQPPP
jgi:hypothetical protein